MKLGFKLLKQGLNSFFMLFMELADLVLILSLGSLLEELEVFELVLFVSEFLLVEA